MKSQWTFLIATPLYLILQSLSGAPAIADGWEISDTRFPAIEFSSREELRDTLIDHAKVATYFRPKGALVVESSYRFSASSDGSTSRMNYDIGFLGNTRPFQSEVTFNGCATDLSKCSLRISLAGSSQAIVDMIPEMRLSFQVVGTNAEGHVIVQPKLIYRKGPKYEELLGRLPAGILDRAIRNQLDPLVSALNQYRLQNVGRTGMILNPSINATAPQRCASPEAK